MDRSQNGWLVGRWNSVSAISFCRSERAVLTLDCPFDVQLFGGVLAGGCRKAMANLIHPILLFTDSFIDCRWLEMLFGRNP